MSFKNYILLCKKTDKNLNAIKIYDDNILTKTKLLFETIKIDTNILNDLIEMPLGEDINLFLITYKNLPMTLDIDINKKLYFELLEQLSFKSYPVNEIDEVDLYSLFKKALKHLIEERLKFYV